MTFDGWQATVQVQHAIPLYEKFWDGCEVYENDTMAADEETALLLDYGDVDKIILVDGGQKQMAQRFRKPYWDGEKWADPDFTLRYSRPTSDNTVEYERLVKAHGDPTASSPPLYAYGRVHNDHEQGLYELYVFNTDILIGAIKSGEISENGPIRTSEGQEMMAYNLDDIRRAGAIVKEWSETPDSDGPERQLTLEDAMS